MTNETCYMYSSSLFLFLSIHTNICIWKKRRDWHRYSSLQKLSLKKLPESLRHTIALRSTIVEFISKWLKNSSIEWCAPRHDLEDLNRVLILSLKEYITPTSIIGILSRQSRFCCWKHLENGQMLCRLKHYFLFSDSQACFSLPSPLPSYLTTVCKSIFLSCTSSHISS